MKNYWLQRLRKREITFRFGLTGVVPMTDVGLTKGTLAQTLKIMSIESGFVKLDQSNNIFPVTDGKLKISRLGILIEIWNLYDVLVCCLLSADSRQGTYFSFT